MAPIAKEVLEMSVHYNPSDEIELPGGRFRIVDLSHPLSADATGHTGHGLKMKRGNFDFDDSFYHHVEIHSHLGTHVEVPRNVSLDYPDALDTPISSFVGWLQLIDLRDLPPNHQLTVDDLKARGLERVKPGDIAGIYGRHKGGYHDPANDKRVRLSVETMQALVDRGIRAVLMDNGTLSLETSKAECRAMHETFLGRNIPIFENFYTLETLKSDRVFFIGAPLPIKDLDSSPVRAIAFDPL
jgi:arylformamidase